MAIKIRGALSDVQTVKYPHASATTKDTIYLINGRPMLAVNSAEATDANTFVYAGRIEYAKVSAQAWAAGDDIYWDNSAAKFTTVQASNYHAGIAGEAAANPSSTGIVDLIPTTVQSV